MKVPQEIAEKTKAYQDHIKEARKNYDDVIVWLKENTDIDGVFVEDLFVTDTPTGREQGEGEYCDQHSVGWCEDSFAGKYYHPIEGSDKYLGYRFEC